MECEKCGTNISEQEEVFRQAGQNLCEDCYLDRSSVPKTCNPMQVRSAKIAREKSGQKGTEGLLPLQKEVYDYLKEHGKATRQEVMEKFSFDQKELEKHVAVLRHCELVKGLKEGNNVYLTTMN